MTPVYAGDPTTPRLATRETGDETWAPILIAPGYEASSLGRVRSVERTITRTNGAPQIIRGRVLRPMPTGDGYRYVRTAAGRKHRVHRLVLVAFHGIPAPGHIGCHNDGDRTNNVLTNLRWDTPSANVQDQVRHGTHRTAGKTREGERCPLGHLLVDSNLIPSRAARGHVGCLACSRGAAEQRRHGQHPDEIQQRADRHYIHILEGSL